jgi:hypothetical protein
MEYAEYWLEKVNLTEFANRPPAPWPTVSNVAWKSPAA